jgi:hypothetical protein
MKSPRRGFLIALAAAPLAPAAVASAQAPPVPAPPPAPPADAPTLADALTEGARRLFGGQFPGTGQDEVAKGIVANLKAAETLKAARALTNADEPVTTFDPRSALLRATRGGKR